MIRVCEQCGQKNRVPAKHLADTGKCGQCKAAIPPIAEPVNVASVADFDEIVNSATVPVLVDFWADWCGPCKMAAPYVAETAKSMAGQAVVLKVDTERLQELGARYNVRGIPNFVVFKGGKLVAQQAGVMPAAQMMQWLRSAAA